MFLLYTLLSQTLVVSGFVFNGRGRGGIVNIYNSFQNNLSIKNQLNAEEGGNDSLEVSPAFFFMDPEDIEIETETIEIVDVVLKDHKPLGCTVEESLAHENSEVTAPVFISKIVDGGNAQRAGLLKGDVIIAISGIFDEMVDDDELDVEMIKGFVVARPEDEELKIRVKRGTSVMEDHEQALNQLCTIEIGEDGRILDIDQCITDYLTDAPDMEHQNPWRATEGAADNNDNQQCSNNDTDCLLDKLCDMWGEECEVPVYNSNSNNNNNNNNNNNKEETIQVKKPAPWSSRSSPSGTWVRNPKTGKLENIDD